MTIDKVPFYKALRALPEWREIKPHADRWLVLATSTSAPRTSEERSVVRLLRDESGPAPSTRLQKAASMFRTVLDAKRGPSLRLVEEGEDWYSRAACERGIHGNSRGTEIRMFFGDRHRR